MHAISSYRDNKPAHTPTHKQAGPITIHCAAASAQCKNVTTVCGRAGAFNAFLGGRADIFDVAYLSWVTFPSCKLRNYWRITPISIERWLFLNSGTYTTFQDASDDRSWQLKCDPSLRRRWGVWGDVAGRAWTIDVLVATFRWCGLIVST